MVSGWRQFVRARVAVTPTAETVRLVTDGLYRYTRNPMYLGLTLILIGVAAARGTWPFYAAALAFFMIVDGAFFWRLSTSCWFLADS